MDAAKPELAEVTGSEGACDLAHVRANAGDARRVLDIPLQLDPATIGKRIEVVGRSVLIDAYGTSTAFLHRGKCAIVLSVVVRRRLCLSADRRGDDRKHEDGNESYSHWRLE